MYVIIILPILNILNANPAVAAPLNEQEIKDFLTTGKLNIHIGTIDEKGHPNIHPTWYYFDHSDNKFYILTGKESKKINNLKKNEIVYFCIDDPNPPYKGVRGKGNARIIEDINFNIRIAQRIALKYIGTLEHRTSHDLVERLNKGQGIVLEINPKYYSTWDYSKV